MLPTTSMAMRAGARRVVRPSISSVTAAAPITNQSLRGLTQNFSSNARGLSYSRSTHPVATQKAAKRGYATTTTNPNPPLGKKNASNDVPSRIGLIGARGYTGQALIDLLNEHPYMDLRYVSSREFDGQELQGYSKRKIIYENLAPEDVHRLNPEIDCWVMALPNGVSKPYVEMLDQANQSGDHKSLIVDLSADYRFTDSWTYGLPELQKRSTICQSLRISNPGCFSTASQLAIAPILEFVDSTPTIFGVSGYSGAGVKKSPKNDVELLDKNLLPYSLVGHLHEAEVSRHLDHPVAFHPHVASWFRGIHLTVSIPLKQSMNSRDLRQIYQDRYAGEKLVSVVGEPPLVKDISGKHHVEVGGFAVDRTGTRVVVCATIDNLNKGAATQCLQNMNLALGYGEYQGIPI